MNDQFPDPRKSKSIAIGIVTAIAVALVIMAIALAVSLSYSEPGGTSITTNDSTSDAASTVCSHFLNTWYTTRAATCTRDGEEVKQCDLCGAVLTTRTIPVTHKWQDAACNNPKTCTVCGITEGEPTGHNMVNAVCTYCGERKEILLYEDQRVRISFKSVKKYPYESDRADVYLYVENKSAKTILIQADAIAINGYSYSHVIVSDAVPAQTIGTVEISVMNVDFNDVDITNITSIGGQLRIIDDSDSSSPFKTYNATFTNIPIE